MIMSRIRIKHFGPIKEGIIYNNGWLDIKKVTVFIGNQGSGKSSIAKLISTFAWIEKVLTRGDFIVKEFTAKKFKERYCGYHRLANYFIKDRTEIDYEGESYFMKYSRDGKFSITKVKGALNIYHLPQIMYVPAERNFLSIVNRPSLIKELPDSLLTFLSEYDKAKRDMKETIELPINNSKLEYKKHNDMLYVKGEDYNVQLTEASSGFQSLVPLYLVSNYLVDSVKKQAENSTKMSSDDVKRFEDGVEAIWGDPTLTDEQRRLALSVLSGRFNKSAFYNIVEEPEQNLYPESQQKILYSLLDFNNQLPANKLVITTHSPYIINYLTLSVKAGQIKDNLTDILKEKLNTIFPIKSTIKSEDLAIYEIDSNGSIRVLEKLNGLPSDEHYLNESLDDSNDLFADLLELQQGL